MKEVNQNNEKVFLRDSVFEMTGAIEPPVIKRGDPGTENNKYGFEGSRALKLYNKNFYQIPGIWEAKSDSVFDGYFASVGMIRLKLVR